MLMVNNNVDKYITTTWIVRYDKLDIQLLWPSMYINVIYNNNGNIPKLSHICNLNIEIYDICCLKVEERMVAHVSLDTQF